MAVNPIPEDYPRVIPYLTIDGAANAIDFYKDILGAEERMRMPAPDGGIAHAELTVGDSMIMLADASPEAGSNAPGHYGGSPVTLMVYVENVDDTYGRALAAGAKEVRGLEDQFYGDRTAAFEDPFGHQWYIASHIEDVSEEEMGKRMAEMMGGGA